MFKPIVPPIKCPSCNSILKHVDDKHIICENHEYCPAQTSYRITSFLDVLGVNGLGDKIVDKLLENQIIRDPADLYNIDIEKASQIEGVSSVVLTKVYKDLINKSKKVSLPKFIKCLSIKNIGESATEKAMSVYPDLNSMMSMEVNKLTSIEGIGPSIAMDFIIGMDSRKELISKLLPNITITSASSGPLNEKTFCFTGFRSSELEEKIKDLGGSISASVTKVTTHLVCVSTDSMSTKAQKAKKDGKEVISKAELEEMLSSLEE